MPQRKSFLSAATASTLSLPGYAKESGTSASRKVDRTCVVTLPGPWTVGETLYRRLRVHEERHCHGERHHATLFQHEEPFE